MESPNKIVGHEYSSRRDREVGREGSVLVGLVKMVQKRYELIPLKLQ